jgi:hypothetical protein
LEKWGYDVSIINYTNSTHNNKADMSKTKKVLDYIFNRDIPLIQKIIYRAKKKNRIKMQRLFSNFYMKNFNFLPENPVNISELSLLTKDLDILITGSDQVWNPINHGGINDPICFLTFGNHYQTKIAYAPSFGISSIPYTSAINLKELLDDFDSISVREKEGADIIKKHCGIDVPVVLDPTLMADSEIFDSFRRTPLPSLPKKFILCYRFGNLPYFQNSLKRIAKLLHLPIVDLPCSGSAYGKGTKLCFDIDPSLFISAINNATLIVTDSFHCTVFSILQHKPFLTFLRQGESAKHSMDNRMLSLLDDFKLSSRLVLPNQNRHFDKKFLFEIDYSEADDILCKNRVYSQAYLLKALEKKSEKTID